ncbi:MAG: sugar ABC transporter ATP-binding protein [Eubacteriales bacterium]|nr:sugar ABC transporter ATP-binding protein [Eubacteriales bacterium]
MNTLLQMIGIEKSFSGVKVLKGVDFTVGEGEIHGLMGENGAGKSTLIKILTGVYPGNSGVIRMNGKEIFINSRSDAMANGISVIYQELSLIPTLTVMENIFLGQELTFGKVFLKKKEMHRRAEQLIEKCRFDIKPDDLVETLCVAKRQTVEIMKSLLLNAKLIIMDEPTASLNAAESENLFKIIRNLKSQGTSIVYISHRLEEIYAMVDRLTILRDGAVVGVLPREQIDPVTVVRMMIGKCLDCAEHTVHDAASEAAVLEVTNLCSETLLDHVSFRAYGGQILGIGGLVGSGRSEVLRSIFGLDHYTEGSIRYNGEALPRSAREVSRYGIGLVPEDRRNEGLIPLLNIVENMALPNYDQLYETAFVSGKRERQLGMRGIESLSIRPGDPNIRCINLSGGNQQKVVISKWLQRKDLKVLLVDEPTAGIDVGAKAEIYEIMRRLANQGCIVIVVTSDVEELIKIADQILIMVDGKVFQQMRNENLTQDDILLAASRIKRKEPDHAN